MLLAGIFNEINVKVGGYTLKLVPSLTGYQAVRKSDDGFYVVTKIVVVVSKSNLFLKKIPFIQLVNVADGPSLI